MTSEPRAESDPEQVWQRLQSLVGIWRGTGSGSFPTIDSFGYDEEIRFAMRSAEERTLGFEQRTQRFGADGVRTPSHWEAGFWIVQDNGQVELLNAQNSGRVEVLRGGLTGSPSGFALCLDSVVHAHDPRVICSRRLYSLAEDRLRVAVEMGTTHVPERTGHLEIELQRVGLAGASSAWQT